MADLEPLTVDEIPWALPSLDDDDERVDLLMFDADGLYAYAVSDQDDKRILKRIMSELLTLAYDLTSRLQKATTRNRQLLQSIQAANAEIRRLRSERGDDV